MPVGAESQKHLYINLLLLFPVFTPFSSFCAFVQSIIRVDSGDQTMGLPRGTIMGVKYVGPLYSERALKLRS